jgi:ABC-2 type transport system ATP-binding protein
MEEADDLCTRVAIMHSGKVVVIGTPEELKAAVGGSDTTLDDVFVHFAGDTLESGGSFRETASERRMAK